MARAAAAAAAAGGGGGGGGGATLRGLQLALGKQKPPLGAEGFAALVAALVGDGGDGDGDGGSGDGGGNGGAAAATALQLDLDLSFGGLDSESAAGAARLLRELDGTPAHGIALQGLKLHGNPLGDAGALALAPAAAAAVCRVARRATAMMATAAAAALQAPAPAGEEEQEEQEDADERAGRGVVTPNGAVLVLGLSGNGVEDDGAKALGRAMEVRDCSRSNGSF